MRLMIRFWRIFWGIMPPIGMMIRDYHLSLIAGEGFDWNHPRRRRRARRLVRRFASLGPTFIKLAQVLAARADLFPGIYLEELRQLHDHVPPMANRRVLRQLESSTGRSVSETFDEFGTEPIASASLGQVHRAVYQGNTVAVKVLKPGIRELVDKDLRVVAWVFSLASLFFQNNQLNSLITIYEQFSRTIHEEMDFELEAEHVRSFQAQYADDDRVRIPAVFDELSTREVLVLEWMEGTKISDVEAVKAAGHDIPDLIDRLVGVFAEQILRRGTFHADPHPGNIFVNESGQLCLLDFGLVVHIPDDVRMKYMQAVMAAVQRDSDQLASLAFDLGAVGTDVNTVVLRQAVHRLMEISLRDDLGPIQMQRIVHKIMQVFYDFPLQLPGDLVYVVKTMSLVEGLGALYQPGYNLMKDARDTWARILAPELERMTDSVVDRVTGEAKAVWDLYGDTKAVMSAVAREELSVRVYRGDLAELQRVIGYAVRRLVASLTVVSIWATGAIVFSNTGNWWVLSTSALIGIIGLGLIFLMPNVPKLPRIVIPNRGPASTTKPPSKPSA
jgi:predicted unusual protein kinase regulating ubiquinone biosynthesis (AarF/ABC1/UbiB family)